MNSATYQSDGEVGEPDWSGRRSAQFQLVSTTGFFCQEWFRTFTFSNNSLFNLFTNNMQRLEERRCWSLGLTGHIGSEVCAGGRWSSWGKVATVLRGVAHQAMLPPPNRLEPSINLLNASNYPLSILCDFTHSTGSSFDLKILQPPPAVPDRSPSGMVAARVVQALVPNEFGFPFNNPVTNKMLGFAEYHCLPNPLRDWVCDIETLFAKTVIALEKLLYDGKLPSC